MLLVRCVLPARKLVTMTGPPGSDAALGAAAEFQAGRISSRVAPWPWCRVSIPQAIAGAAVTTSPCTGLQIQALAGT